MTGVEVIKRVNHLMKMINWTMNQRCRQVLAVQVMPEVIIHWLLHRVYCIIPLGVPSQWQFQQWWLLQSQPWLAGLATHPNCSLAGCFAHIVSKQALLCMWVSFHDSFESLDASQTILSRAIGTLFYFKITLVLFSPQTH